MKVLISWSGSCSKEVAEALYKLIPDLIHNVDLWMSSEDVSAGARWYQHITDVLARTSFGILCLTAENYNAPWVLFEAGALAKTLENTLVCPYLIDLSPTDLVNSPLSQFQAKAANKTQTYELVLAIHRALGGESRLEESLRRNFERAWPELEEKLGNILATTSAQRIKSPLEEMVKETLAEAHFIKKTLEEMKAAQPVNIILDAELEQALQRSEAQAKEIRDRLTATNQEMAALKESYEHEKQQSAKRQQELQTIGKQKTELEQALKRSKAQAKEVQTKLTTANHTMAALKESSEREKQQAVRRQQELQTIGKQKTELEQALQRSEAQISKLKEEAAAAAVAAAQLLLPAQSSPFSKAFGPSNTPTILGRRNKSLPEDIYGPIPFEAPAAFSLRKRLNRPNLDEAQSLLSNMNLDEAQSLLSTLTAHIESLQNNLFLQYQRKNRK